MKAWHFTGERLRDGREIPAIGEWLKFEGEIIPCKQGLHASLEPWDALRYAPGSMLHYVELRGDKKRKLKRHGSPVDKVVGCQRKILITVNMEGILRDFARECALGVIGLWDAPEVVVEYLKTGDKRLRAAARAAAGAAAGAAAWAARAAAWAAAGDAARAAAWAARAAAWAAAGDAARAARDAARAAGAAAGDAARAARDAARAAARDAAGAAAWAAAGDAQRQRFNSLVYQAFGLDEIGQEKPVEMPF